MGKKMRFYTISKEEITNIANLDSAAILPNGDIDGRYSYSGVRIADYVLHDRFGFPILGCCMEVEFYNAFPSYVREELEKYQF